MVESKLMVKGASPGPAPAAQARASNWRLTRSSWRTWPHRKMRRNVPRVDGALTTPPRAQAVPWRAAHRRRRCAARQGGSDQRHDLIAGVGPARGIAQVEVLFNQLGQAQMPGQGGRKDQPSIGHQAAVIEGDLDAVGVVAWQHLLGAPCSGAGLLFQTIIPDAREHLLAASGR